MNFAAAPIVNKINLLIPCYSINGIDFPCIGHIRHFRRAIHRNSSPNNTSRNYRRRVDNGLRNELLNDRERRLTNNLFSEGYLLYNLWTIEEPFCPYIGLELNF